MMLLILKLAIVFLNIIYFFIKLFPTKNKITMISRQSDKITTDFKLLKKEINKSTDYQVVILTKKLKPGIKNKISYVFHMFKQMYHIATSKCVILDSYCIPISLLKHKKKLVVIQMWHAMGCLKKFGYSIEETNSSTSAFDKEMTIEKKKKINKVMRMHKGYNYIFASSESSAPHFAEAFGYDIDSMVVMPLPIVDLLTDSNYKEEVNKRIKNTYPIMKKKKNIVYVPTFRPEEKEEKIQELIDSIDYKKYNLIIKLHPLTNLSNYDERVIWDKKFSSQDMMIAGNYIITDYSAIVYEASLLNKPLFFYTYDYDEYVNKRDFYTDFKKELPGFISTNSKDIIEAIEHDNYDLTRIHKFRNEYIDMNSDTVCHRIVLFIKKVIKR